MNTSVPPTFAHTLINQEHHTALPHQHLYYKAQKTNRVTKKLDRWQLRFQSI